ncbi:MAG TPA: hypothetical protein PKC27_00765, partial [Methanomethylovorans sp.]|nr:hypothetical protein [Methanomethylovorans sp.]
EQLKINGKKGKITNRILRTLSQAISKRFPSEAVAFNTDPDSPLYSYPLLPFNISVSITFTFVP